MSKLWGGVRKTMAQNNNYAKDIVIEEATRLASQLQNGGAGCTETQGRAIGFLVKMIVPMYKADFVTVEECRRQHTVDDAKYSKIKVGPVEIEGRFGPLATLFICNILCLGGIAFVVGKTQNWW